MTIQRNLIQIVVSSALVMCCLSQNASAQGSKILTIYCPGMADVKIDGSPTYTRGSVRQYAINYSQPHTLRIHMTGLVGKELKSVSREVPLNSNQLNYIARFHAIPEADKSTRASETTRETKAASSPQSQSGNVTYRLPGQPTPPILMLPEESDKLKFARHNLELKEAK
jgi:hypothetical protein